MFSSAVSVGIRLKDWKTKPIWSRRTWVSALSSSVREVGAADEDLAGGERVEAGHAVHQRGLARARRAHDRGEAAGLEVDGDAVEGPHLGVAGAVDLDGVDGAGGRRGGRRRGGSVAVVTARRH